MIMLSDFYNVLSHCLLVNPFITERQNIEQFSFIGCNYMNMLCLFSGQSVISVYMRACAAMELVRIRKEPTIASAPPNIDLIQA